MLLQGQVLKIVNTVVKLEGVKTATQPIMIEELQVLPHGQPILGLKILQMSEAANKSLLVISSSALVSLPLQRCGVAATCSACLALQDPYCGWDVVSSSCVSHTTFNSLYASEFLQNVSFGRHRQCGDSQSSVIIEEFKVRIGFVTTHHHDNFCDHHDPHYQHHDHHHDHHHDDEHVAG